MNKNLTATFIHDNLSFEQAATRYEHRRRDFLKKCKHLCVISGVRHSLEQQNFWLLCDYPLFQDPSLLYLTGLNQEKVALIFNPFTSKICLALPEYNEKKVFWDGHFLGYSQDNVDAIKKAFKYDDVIDYASLFEYLEQELYLSNCSKIATIWNEDKSQNNQLHDFQFYFKEDLSTFIKSLDKTYQLENYSHNMNSRLCLDDVDINNAKQANECANSAFKITCENLHTCSSETDVAGFLKGSIYKQCPLGQSFPAIIASEKNAAILHYKKNDAPLVKNSLLLLDFGCRLHNVVSDISRTIPVNGTFNPLQALLYTIVLDAQKEVESLVKVGCSIDDLNTRCWEFIESELNKKVTNQNGIMKRAYKTQPHNVGHLIGHCVHDGDPFRLYRNQPLKEGMIISNEPGIYGYFELEINGQLYQEHCGIRIEDNLLVQKNGCINLSSMIPKEIPAIEALISKH